MKLHTRNSQTTSRRALRIAEGLGLGGKRWEGEGANKVAGGGRQISS